MREVDGFAELEKIVGEKVGASEWVTITQQMVNRFADVTLDHQWIHVDVERACRESPYGEPVVHGFLTLSLIPNFRQQCLRITGVSRFINYGLNKVRFPNAVPVGARIRGVQTVHSVERITPDVMRMTNKFVIEIDKHDKPACVAETVTLVYA